MQTEKTFKQELSEWIKTKPIATSLPKTMRSADDAQTMLVRGLRPRMHRHPVFDR
jgi:hypothetical protein